MPPARKEPRGARAREGRKHATKGKLVLLHEQQIGSRCKPEADANCCLHRSLLFCAVRWPRSRVTVRGVRKAGESPIRLWSGGSDAIQTQHPVRNDMPQAGATTPVDGLALRTPMAFRLDVVLDCRHDLAPDVAVCSYWGQPDSQKVARLPYRR